MLQRRLDGSSRPSLVLAALALAALLTAPAFGAGFSIFEQGSKAMGTAGAFAGQADDGSAIFYNVGGLGFLKEKSHTLGVTVIQINESTFKGANPFPGIGVTADIEENTFTPVHYYYVRPLSDRLTFGFGFNTPFGLTTEWKNPETFPGRFLNAKAELRTFDLVPSIGYQVNETFSIGASLIARFSDVSLERFVPAINPFTQTATDIAFAKLESDLDEGYGFQVGFLHKPGEAFSWGFTYRGEIEVDYGGDGRFSQVLSGDPRFDGLVAGLLPFDQKLPLKTSITMPASANLGVSIALTERLRLNADIGWTEWTAFDAIVLEFTDNPEFTSVLPQGWDDAYNYRVGVAFNAKSGRVWRFGYVYDETPQPEEGVGPLLPDANRTGLTFGYGGRKLDLAVMYLVFDDRETLTNRDNFFGQYETNAWLLGVTYKF